MKPIKPVAPLLIFIPAIAYIPISIEIFKGLHIGGLNIIILFITSALNPSLDLVIIKSGLEGIQITIAIALISWIISMLFGIILGVLSSDLLCKYIPNFSLFGKLIKYGLAFPRSIHEVIWGILFIQFLGLNVWVAVISIVIPYSALTARIVSEQLDSVEINPLKALGSTGAKALPSLITFLFPKLIKIISIYGSYRLECAIRGATLLGIFGLGGIGSELYLTLRSLEFREMWTFLWLLFLVVIILEKITRSLRNNLLIDINTRKSFFISLLIFIASLFLSLSLLHQLGFDIFIPFKYTDLTFPSLLEFRKVFDDLSLIKLTSNTVIITLLASGVAIGTPPILLLIFPDKLSLKLQSIIWIFFRLTPPPLTAIIILMFSSPNISVAALSLGITHMGVMGRLLNDIIKSQKKDIYKSLKCNGSSNRSAILYGIISPKSNNYLAYGSYRIDVILKETAIIGVVGGVGLGWQLQESLSSFDWAQVMIITSTFSLLTISGEFILKNFQNYWLRNSTNNFVH